MTNQQITDRIYDLKKTISAGKEEIFKLYCEMWENYYKDRCGNNYMPYEDVIQNISIDGLLEVSKKVLDAFENECKYDIGDACINRVINAVIKYNLTLNYKFTKMICTACACEGCPYLKEHLGYDCEECRSERNYKGYQGYCDE